MILQPKRVKKRTSYAPEKRKFQSDEKVRSVNKDHAQQIHEESIVMDDDQQAHSENQQNLSQQLDTFSDEFERRNTESIKSSPLKSTLHNAKPTFDSKEAERFN